MSDRIAEIQQREEKATKGPWFTGPHYRGDVHSREGVIRANCWQAPQVIADAEFIANAREDIPYLLAALSASEAARQQAEQEIASLHQFGRDWQREALAAQEKTLALSTALRALVMQWSIMSDPYHQKCADELEALLREAR